VSVQMSFKRRLKSHDSTALQCQNAFGAWLEALPVIFLADGPT